MISCLKSGSCKQLQKHDGGMRVLAQTISSLQGLHLAAQNTLRMLFKEFVLKTLVQNQPHSINRIKNPSLLPIIPLFFHIISYLHKNRPVNYLTRGVKNIPHRGGGGKCLSER